ncbi:UNVERIFIED_CONTAM: hypothetical protein Slati_0381100 [Sesamum latifolium]|uniref:Transmembrane protein n=1 Tax=Sesamum latifolium TaxID=2727402 RepID=A0AAW2YGZ5_9LAMI
MMALAEARAAWQRTANRCFVQEDAKRAPKLACCSPVTPSVKQAETGTNTAAAAQDTPSTGSLPLNLPSYSNLSPNSKWWLQLQPSYGYQKGLMDEQFNSLEANMETCQMQESSRALARKEDDPGLINQTTSNTFSSESQYRSFTTGDKKDFGVKEDIGELKLGGLVGGEVLKNANELYLDSESSWIEGERNTPWWRTADTDELALLVSRSLLGHIENCDLPSPQSTRVKKDMDVNTCCFGHDRIPSSLLDPNLNCGSPHHFSTHLHPPGSLTAESASKNLSMPDEAQLAYGTNKPLRDMPTHEKAQLMEALRHSQTRAREAERAATQACAEKEHVVKLVFKQAYQLFAYRQWLQLLQLENMYLHFKNNKTQSVSIVFPIMLPWTARRSRKMRKNWQKSPPSRKGAKRSYNQHDVNKYAVAFAIGLGLVGAGFLLGWTVAWMLPTW